MSSNLSYAVRYYNRKEGSLTLDNSRLVVEIRFLLKYCGAKKTHSAVTPRSCNPSGNGRDRDGTERTLERRGHEFSQNYCPSYESFPRFPPNSQSTGRRTLAHSWQDKNKEKTSRDITRKLQKIEWDETLKPSGVGVWERSKVRGATRRPSAVFAQSRGNWGTIVYWPGTIAQPGILSSAGYLPKIRAK